MEADPDPRGPASRSRTAPHRRGTELVGELGPSKVTLANVGERAGYSRGLATHHFGSKGALMQRLVEAVTHQFREAMFDQMAPRTSITELRTLVGIYFDVVTDLQPVNRARLMLWADAVAHPDERHPRLDGDRRQGVPRRGREANQGRGRGRASAAHGRSAWFGHRRPRHAPRCGAAIPHRRSRRPRSRSHRDRTATHQPTAEGATE